MEGGCGGMRGAEIPGTCGGMGLIPHPGDGDHWTWVGRHCSGLAALPLERGGTGWGWALGAGSIGGLYHSWWWAMFIPVLYQLLALGCLVSCELLEERVIVAESLGGPLY